MSCVHSSFACLVGQLCTLALSGGGPGQRPKNAYILPCMYTVLLRTLLLPVALGHPLLNHTNLYGPKGMEPLVVMHLSSC
jgi:hypothetical protein